MSVHVTLLNIQANIIATTVLRAGIYFPAFSVSLETRLYLPGIPRVYEMICSQVIKNLHRYWAVGPLFVLFRLILMLQPRCGPALIPSFPVAWRGNLASVQTLRTSGGGRGVEPTFVLHTAGPPAAGGVEGQLEQRAGKRGWASTAPAAEPSSFLFFGAPFSDWSACASAELAASYRTLTAAPPRALRAAALRRRWRRRAESAAPAGSARARRAGQRALRVRSSGA